MRRDASTGSTDVMRLAALSLAFGVPLLMAGSIVLSCPAWAANRHVDVVNKTGMDIQHFYASSTGTDDWEEDILGKDVVESGETFDIDIDDGSGACRFDLRAVFTNGAESVMRNIDVCKVDTVTYTAR